MSDRERGRRVAAALAGSWRGRTPPLELARAGFDEIAPILARTGAGGLLWTRVKGTPMERTPQGQALLEAWRYQALTVATHAERIAAALRRLRAVGVDAVVGKGWAAARLYPVPGPRPCGDIDLYVRRRDHAAAAEALRGVAGDLVDLHAGFAELDDRREDELLARARLLEGGAGPIRVFAAEDHLRLLALHALRHGLLRPLWLCDVAAGLESAGPGFDWESFAAGRKRRTEWAFVALELAHAVLGADADAIPPARRARLPAWMVPAVLGEWADPRAPHGARAPVRDLLRHPGRLARGLGLRWPNGIEAAVHLGWSPPRWRPLPAQVAECLRRTASFAARPIGITAGPPDPGYNPRR